MSHPIGAGSRVASPLLFRSALRSPSTLAPSHIPCQCLYLRNCDALSQAHSAIAQSSLWIPRNEGNSPAVGTIDSSLKSQCGSDNHIRIHDDTHVTRVDWTPEDHGNSIERVPSIRCVRACVASARQYSYALCRMPVTRRSPELRTHARAMADSSRSSRVSSRTRLRACLYLSRAITLFLSAW